MEHVQEKESAATKFVLERLKAAGIEVVTGKEEFNRILKAEKLLQKMAESGENPEKIERQRQIINGLVVNQKSLGLSEDNIANAFKQLDRSLRFNANFEIQSEKLGEEVSVFPGSTGKHGLGIRHIIEERTKKDGLSLDEITALSSLIVDAVQTGDITRDSENRCEISKNGIIAIVRKDFDNGRKNWILTGFHYGGEDVEKNREATETVQTVIAKYGQSPDYSYFRSQVGAVIASLDLNISQSPIKSSGVSKIADQNSEAEVKDSAISITSLKTETVNKKASIRSPDDTYRLLSHIKNEGQEHFGVILLDEAYNVKAINTVSVGTKNKSLVHPREVFSEAIRAKAASMIVFHNHPSGNPLPSDEDLNTTRALLKVSEVVDVPIIDHVIATKNSYYSFLEQGILDDLKPKAEFLIKNNRTYGFTHNGKIYLDPEVMNSDAAVHEYTHLWDKYIQTTNLTLWEQGKEIFSKTHLWKEVKDDPNYADISSDDDLILSEIHSRICGKIAEQVLERIASEDGEITRDKAIDWNKEAWDYLSSEFLTVEDKEILFEGKSSKDQINEFISLSLKDLMEEKDISLSQSMEQSKNSALELKSDNPRERVKEITSQLEKGVKDLFESRKYQEYLDVMARFHRYSANNIQLIALQNPNATQVAGFQSWKKDFERSVKKGERGIKILVPVAYKKKAAEHEKKLDEDTVSEGEDLKPDNKEYVTFRIGHVFDVSQTEGKDLPSLGVGELSGSVEQYNEIYSALEKLSPYPMFFEDIESGAKGYCNFSNKKIAVKNGMSEAQTIKTLIHEISHAKLHGDKVTDERTAEVQAESVSYTVCKHFGLDTSDYSFAYVTSWSSGKDTKELKESLDLIRETSVEFIESIEKTISKKIPQKKSREEMMDALKESKVKINGEMTERLSPLNENFMEKVTQGETMENESKSKENKGIYENRDGVDLDLESPYKNRLSEKSFSGRFVPNNSAKLIKETLENNTAPFLPDERGEINARPIVNANTGFCLNLKDLIPMQIKQENTVFDKGGRAAFVNARYTPIVATKKSIDAAHTSIKPGERGVFFNFKRADGTIGTSQYFFPEQTESPDKVIQNARKKMLDRHKEVGGENNTASRASITITSSEPREYLGKYYAAMRTDSALKCSPEIGREFKEKFNAVLENQLADKKDFNPKIGSLHNLFFEADKISSDIIKQMQRDGAHPQAQQKELRRNRKPEMSR